MQQHWYQCIATGHVGSICTAPCQRTPWAACRGALTQRCSMVLQPYRSMHGIAYRQSDRVRYRNGYERWAGRQAGRARAKPACKPRRREHRREQAFFYIASLEKHRIPPSTLQARALAQQNKSSSSLAVCQVQAGLVGRECPRLFALRI